LKQHCRHRRRERRHIPYHRRRYRHHDSMRGGHLTTGLRRYWPFAGPTTFPLS
jgi:hypothetical protein